MNKRSFSRYIYAILAVPIIILTRLALMPLVGPGVPYVTLFPVSVAVALLAGMGPAILTGILGSIVIDYLFIEPLYLLEFNVPGISRMAVVVLTSAFVGYVGNILRAARAKAEKQAFELRESKKDLDRAQAVARSGSWRLDVQQNKLTWSDESYRIFGVSVGTILTYESFFTYIHPDDREYVDKKWKAALNGEKYDIEHRIVVDGQIKWVRERAELDFEKEGTLLGGFGTVTDITRRKDAEEALRKAHDELEGRVTERTAQLAQQAALLELADDAILVRDFDGQITFWNQGAVKTYGYTAKQAIGSITRELLKTVFPEPLDEIKSDVIANSHWEGELLHTRSDGRQIVVASRWALQQDENGRSLGILEINRDITEQKQMESRNRITNVLLELFAQKTSRKAYLDSVVNTIRDWSGCQCVGIRLANSDGLIPYESQIGFSDEFVETENKLCLKTDACICIRAITQSPERQDMPLLTPRGSFYSGNTFKFVDSLTEKGKKRYRGYCMRHGFASLAVVPIRYRNKVLGAIHLADKKENKTPAQTVEFIENIAMLIGEAVHRFDIETELRESEERYRQLVELSPEGIGVERDDKIVFINTAAARLLDAKSSAELIGKSILDFVHPDYRKRTHRQLEFLRRKQKALPLRENIFLRVDRTPIDVEVAATPLVYENRPAAQIVFRDITERKLAQERIIADQKQLRLLTAELLLTEERERHEIAMALHDSLGPILAFSKREIGTLQKSAPAEIAEALKNIGDNISQAVKQTRTLTFDLSPPTLYTLGFEIAIEELLERFCQEHKLEYSFQNSDASKPLTDPVKVLLYRSIRETLINIAKHARAKLVKIAISRADNDIEVIIEDDGRGFDVSAVKEKSKGLGLFSVRERLRHIGGKLEIESKRDKGTHITLTAPLKIE
ncbi:MAG: PAS domain S-box protein [Phycisphaerae bacterium]|jgi:PAS domain S-box-containing protein